MCEKFSPFRAEEVWICLNCGYVICGKCAPERCPACGYPQGYFELNCENY
ncbi:rubredoxin-like domain-containing protein [Eisenbergiella porci]